MYRFSIIYIFYIGSYENNRLNAIKDIIKSRRLCTMYIYIIKCVPVQKARICIYTLVRVSTLQYKYKFP